MPGNVAPPTDSRRGGPGEQFPAMTRTAWRSLDIMLSTAIELTTTCPRCDQPVHVNALVDQICCSHCHAGIELPWAWWSDTLGDAFEDTPTLEIGHGGRIRTLSASDAPYDLLYTRFEPYCFDCKTDLDLDELTGTERLATGQAECPTCGSCWSLREAPKAAGVALPGVQLLVAEDPDLLAGGPEQGAVQSTALPDASGPIIFICPACGGGLRVDGSDRLVPCAHCEASVYLPNDLWFRLRPVSTKQRWFLCWEPSQQQAARRDPEEEEGEEEELEPAPTTLTLAQIMKRRRAGAPPPAEATEPVPPVVEQSSATNTTLALVLAGLFAVLCSLFVAAYLLLATGVG